MRGIGAGHRAACGWLIDRFGLRWQIVPAILDELMRDKDPARSKRVTDALLRMVKLDIAALEKAYRSWAPGAGENWVRAQGFPLKPSSTDASWRTSSGSS